MMKKLIPRNMGVWRFAIAGLALVTLSFSLAVMLSGEVRGERLSRLPLSQSENYRITADVLSQGGGPGSSAGFQVVDSLGEAVETGASGSENFRICSGIACAWGEGPTPNFITITAPTGNVITVTASITVAGQTAPDATVTISLDADTYTTTAQAAGAYAVTGVALTPGANLLSNQSLDRYGNRASATVGITRTTYFLTGTFTSRVHDASQTVAWGTISWQATIPSGASLAFQTRAGGTLDPDDGSWSAWSAPYLTSGQAITGSLLSSRYIQYRAAFTTTDPSLTPVLDEVNITYSPATPPCVSTPYYTIVYGQITVNGQPAPVGTQVSALNPRGDVVGCFPVTTAGQYGFMRIYGEDATANPPIPGMRDGEVVAFQINGQPAIATPELVWHNDRTAHLVNLITQEWRTIHLDSGWNLFSFNVRPSSAAITTVLSSIAGRYDRVLGESGSYDPSLPPMFNSLPYLYAEGGYYIRISGATPVELAVHGAPIAPTSPITLHQGWNWIGYLPQVTWPITQALASIEGCYDLVNDEDDTYAPRLPEFSTLWQMTPGDGYLIRTTRACTLTYPAGSPGLLAVLTGARPASDCGNVARTPDYSMVYGSLIVNGHPAPVGATVEAVTPRGDVAGCFRVTAPGAYGFMRLYGADAAGSSTGFRPGEAVAFRVNGLPATFSSALTWQNDREPHALNLKATFRSILLPLILHGQSERQSSEERKLPSNIYLPLIEGGR